MSGVSTEGGRIVLDIDVIRRDHDVNDDDPNCATCGVEYPCELVESADRIAGWLERRDKTTVPSGAASEQRE